MLGALPLADLELAAGLPPTAPVLPVPPRTNAGLRRLVARPRSRAWSVPSVEHQRQPRPPAPARRPGPAQPRGRRTHPHPAPAPVPPRARGGRPSAPRATRTPVRTAPPHAPPAPPAPSTRRFRALLQARGQRLLGWLAQAIVPPPSNVIDARTSVGDTPLTPCTLSDAALSATAVSDFPTTPVALSDAPLN